MAVRRPAEALHRLLSPGRDGAARTPVVSSLPGDASEANLYADDIAGEMRLIVGDLAAISDRGVAALALHASLVHNRQADADQRLAVVATVLLPVTSLVGFFGMNFDVLVNDLEDGVASFVVLGVVLNIVAVVSTLLWLRRRGWR